MSQLKTNLAWKSQDWARDWSRIARTEKQTAMEEGKADYYRKRYGGETFVAKVPAPDACPHCKRLFLGGDGHPIIFRLFDLEANGTNVGKKVADWLPVVGTVHPYCRCMLIRVPEGYGFDKDGDLVPGGEFGQRIMEPGAFERALMAEEYFHKAFPIQDRYSFQGIPLVIENKAGTIRRWKHPDGSTGETHMSIDYGYVEGTSGLDEDEIDVFVGSDKNAPMVYVIEQQDPETGKYDEQKCMLGFGDQDSAEVAYMHHYDRPDFYLYTDPMPIAQFKQWIAQTSAKRGEMGKSFTISLRKARVQAYIGAENSLAGNRSPSPGLARIMFLRVFRIVQFQKIFTK